MNEDNDFGWYEQGEEAAKEIIELSREPNPDWYEIALLVDDFRSKEFDHYRGPISWEDWSDENSLPTKTIAKHLAIYYLLTEQRAIPLEKYQHLTADQVENRLKPFLMVEPKVPAIAIEWEYPYPELCEWYKWAIELESCLESG